MTPKLKISTFVLKRLEKVKCESSGCLFGVMYNGTLLILGFNVEMKTSDTLNYKQIHNNFPAELDLCGLVKFGKCTDSQAHLNDILQDVDVTDNPILLHCELGTTVGLRASLFKHGQLEDILFDVMDEEELWTELINARLECNLEVVCNEDEKSVRVSMQNLRKYLASGKTGFNIKNTRIYLTGGASGTSIVGIAPDSKIMDVLDAANAAVDENYVAKAKKKTPNTDYDILKVVLLLKLTTEADGVDATTKGGSTKCSLDPTTRKLKIPLQLDSLAMLHRHTAAIALYDILIESVCRSIRMIERSVIEQKFLQRVGDFGVPKTFTFLPKDLGHFFSCVYFSKCGDDDDLHRRHRKKLHQHFGLPLNRPYFRRANKYLFKDEQTSKYLINPHVGIKSQVKDGKLYLVQGKYTYYHYMQNGFDDNGWGCAYRSLQTLCSWFNWQGYSEAAVPEHRDIQSYLVDIGDKPHTFIGSKQWIGSTEVSMCLDGFRKMTSRILRVESGGDLAQQGPTLARHFETQGTPIMIGGGVLAHTILGIDFNSQTNELKFLILDPHYTGADDLANVQSKKWCGWKGCDFWDKKSYYNLCMPQLPTANAF